MPAPAAFLAHGQCGYYEPGLSKQRRLGELDSLRGTWIDDEEDALMPGDAVPNFPGMIIMDVDEVDGGGGSIAYRISGLGDLQNNEPVKVVGKKSRRVLEPTWDTLSVDMFATRCDEHDFTAATTDVLTLVTGTLKNGDQVRVTNLTGAAPLSAATTYHVVQAAMPTFKLSLTSGGSAVDITTTGSGSIVRSQFARGASYGGSGTFFLTDVDADQQGDNDVIPWKRVRLNYLGIQGAKPYKRSISVNGKTLSHDNLSVALPGGGFSNEKGTAQQPTVEVSDTHAFATDPNLYEHVPTSDVFNVAAEGGRTIPPSIVIPDPPTINSIFGVITGDVTFQWPNRWSFMACERVDSIPGTSVVLIRKVWRYEWPKTL
jgi:hypothetical protein